MKPVTNVSSSEYMKYEKYPRKYYIENILGISGDGYFDTEAGEEIAVETNTAGAALLGTDVCQ